MKNNSIFNAYGHYYDLLYKDKDYSAEVNYIDSLLKEYTTSGNILLEFGSGTGRHGRLLAERGYKITGIELSESMVQKACQSNGFTSLQGDIRTIKLNRSYNAVVSLFHVVSYQVTNSDILSVFKNAAEHLL